jgi:3,4-dihydroxy 2-butanone 4-phosphate synthase/GTP cyclohydrolase II
MVPSPRLSKLESITRDDALVNTGNIADDDTDVRIDSIEELKKQLEFAAQFRARYHRPFITVSYAQSIDGSIASRQNKPLALSGPESWKLTHQIRAACDSILVGIGTVLTDNPQLSVRKVDGRNPQPIILDTHLRTPLNAKCVQRKDLSSWLINGGTDSFGKIQALENAGAKPLTCETGSDGKIDLFALMGLLTDRKINSIMVEGGARVITSFVNSKLVDQFIITIAPKMVGGLSVLKSRALDGAPYFNCERVHYQQLGKDIIVWARPEWRTA